MSSIELPEGYRFQTTLTTDEYSMLFTALGKDYEEVVIKSFDCTQMEETQVAEIHRQALLLKTVNHPSVLKVQDVQMNVSNTRLHVIMDPYFKTLQALIDECGNTGRSLPNAIVCQIAYQLISCLQYLSTTSHVAFNEQGQEFSQDRIFHSFITPNDVVFDTSGAIKLMNIFPAERKALYEKGDYTFPALAYAAPEFLNAEYAECPADIWSVGACLFAVAMRRPPFSSIDIETLKAELDEGKKDTLDISFSPELDAMLTHMLTPDQSYRPTASDLLYDPAITAAGAEIESGNLQNPWMAIGFSRPDSQAVAAIAGNDSPIPAAVDPNLVYPIAFDDNNPWERYWLNAPRASVTIDASSYTKGTVGEEVVERVLTPPPEENFYVDSGAAYVPEPAADRSVESTHRESTHNLLPDSFADEIAERVSTPPPEDRLDDDDDAYRTRESECPEYAINSTFGSPPADSVILRDDRVPTPPPEEEPVATKAVSHAYVPPTETAKESKSVTVLINAVRANNIDLVRELVNNDTTDLKWATPNEKRTALMVAADLGNAEAVAILAAHECGEVDADGWRAIDYAAQNGNAEAVRTLLAYEGDMPSARKDGCTPLFQAVFWNKPECVKLLATKYARGATTSHYWQGEGFTALMEAAKCCRLECVEILAPYEADMADRSGKTALDHCRQAWDHVLDDARREACLRILEQAQSGYAAYQ